MVCRESRLSSAMITLARGASELGDREVIAINHALIQEAGKHGDVTVDDWSLFIDNTIDRFHRGFLVTSERSKDPIIRLEEARSQNPSYERYYAATRLVERSVAIANGHQEYLENYARVFGKSLEQVQREFDAIDMYMQLDGKLQATPAFARAWKSDPTHANLLVDNLSLYKYEQLENNLKAFLGTSERTMSVSHNVYRRAVERQPVEHSSWISELGYDPINGRLEMVTREKPDKVYAYKMNLDDYERIFIDIGDDPIGKRFQLVKGNADFAYENADEAEENAYHFRCRTCGQFAGPVHYCPVLGSDTLLNRDTRVLVNLELDALGLPLLPESADGPLVAGRRNRVFTNEDNGHLATIRMSLSPKALAQEARKSPTAAIRIDISAILADRDFGNTDRAKLSGQVKIEYEGSGRGYLVVPVTELGDSGEDNLRCSCDIYRSTLECPHLILVSENIATLIQGEQRLSNRQDEVFEAAEEARRAILESYEQSLTAADKARQRWHPVTQSYVDNPQLFEKFYNEALAVKDTIADTKSGIDATAYPVPYLTENAFGGLGRRGGRGFGTELEFEFPSTMSPAEMASARKAIGDALYESGLTRSEHQLPQGETRGDYKSTHSRGWAYEEDNTVSTGGEIISPIMYDEPETWANLKKVCDIIKDHGGIPTSETGGHVHVGIGDFNHTIANHNRFFQSYEENEDLLFRLSTNPESGEHRSHLSKASAVSLKSLAPNHFPSSPYASIDVLPSERAAIGTHYIIGEVKDHLEFRTFDGSLNPAIIQAQIGVSLYMTEAAMRESQAPISLTEKAVPLGTTLAKNGEKKRRNKRESLESSESIRKFIDRFVPGSEDGIEENNSHARQIISLFAITKWQKA